MKIYDGKKLVEIKMMTWKQAYTPDWSIDFFDAGSLEYDEKLDAYRVKDVDYCIDQANDWADGVGDFSEDHDLVEVLQGNRCVDVDYIIEKEG